MMFTLPHHVKILLIIIRIMKNNDYIFRTFFPEKMFPDIFRIIGKEKEYAVVHFFTDYIHCGIVITVVTHIKFRVDIITPSDMNANRICTIHFRNKLAILLVQFGLKSIDPFQFLTIPVEIAKILPSAAQIPILRWIQIENLRIENGWFISIDHMGYIFFERREFTPFLIYLSIILAELLKWKICGVKSGVVPAECTDPPAFIFMGNRRRNSEHLIKNVSGMRKITDIVIDVDFYFCIRINFFQRQNQSIIIQLVSQTAGKSYNNHFFFLDCSVAFFVENFVQ